MHQNFQTGRRPVARVLLFFLPAAVETLRLGSGRSVPAGAAHGAAAPLLAPRPFKLPGLPPSPPTHGEPLSQPSLRPLHPTVPPPGLSDAAAARSNEAVLS